MLRSFLNLTKLPFLSVANAIEVHDQWVLNRLIFENSVNIRILPLVKFPYGELYFDKMPPNAKKNVIIIHNNWIIGRTNKIERFEKHNLWYKSITGKLFHSNIILE